MMRVRTGFLRLAKGHERLFGAFPIHAMHGAIALGACAISLWAAPSQRGVFGGVLAALMLAIAVVDARRFLIPNWLVAAAAVLGLLYAGFDRGGSGLTFVFVAVLRGLVWGGIFLIIKEGYRRFRGRDGIGLGDVKLAVAAGIWLDWTAMTFAIELAALAALCAIGLRAARGHRICKATIVPFGLFFAPAIWFGWLFQVLTS